MGSHRRLAVLHGFSFRFHHWPKSHCDILMGQGWMPGMERWRLRRCSLSVGGGNGTYG